MVAMGTRGQSARPGQVGATDYRMEIGGHIGPDRLAQRYANRGPIVKKIKATEAAQKVTLNCNNTSAARQRATVIQALRIMGTTTVEFREIWGLMSPAPRVMELRMMGYDIRTTFVSAHTIDGVKHYGVARYVLVSEPKAANDDVIAPDCPTNDSEDGALL